MIELRASGFVFHECLDPAATEFPRERPDIAAPVRVRVGKGSQFRYSVTDEQAGAILSHAHVFGEAMSYGVDDPSVGRRVLAWVEREADRLGFAYHYDGAFPVYTRAETETEVTK